MRTVRYYLVWIAFFLAPFVLVYTNCVAES